MIRGTTFYVLLAGILLVVGAVLPIYQDSYFSDTKFFSLNFEILGESGVKFWVKFFFIYPLFAGIAAIVLSRLQISIGRSVSLTLLAFLPIIVAVSSEQVSDKISFFGDNAMMGFSTIGLLLIFISAFTLMVRSEYKTALILLSLGGLFFLISQFIISPISRDEYITLLTGFELLFSDTEMFLPHSMGFAQIVNQVLMGVVIFLTIQIWRNPDFAQYHSNRIIQVWVASLLVSLSTILIVVIIGISENSKQTASISGQQPYPPIG